MLSAWYPFLACSALNPRASNPHAYLSQLEGEYESKHVPGTPHASCRHVQRAPCGQPSTKRATQCPWQDVLRPRKRQAWRNSLPYTRFCLLFSPQSCPWVLSSVQRCRQALTGGLFYLQRIHYLFLSLCRFMIECLWSSWWFQEAPFNLQIAQNEELRFTFQFVHASKGLASRL